MTVIVCAPASGQSAVVPAASAPVAAAPREDLARLAARSVLFGHQSVGENILDGVGRLASAAGVGPRVARLDLMVAPSPGVLGHLLLPEDGDPARKLRAFADAIDRLGDRAPDIALVKLCYADFDAPGTDAAALLELYRRTLAELEARHPRTAFVHVTVPITRPSGGAKALVRRLMGKAPRGIVENVRREEFNSRMRASSGDRVFDLARLEATGPAGEKATVEWQGRAVPALFPAYTDDGAHLNALGQDAVARAFVAHLAGVPVR